MVVAMLGLLVTLHGPGAAVDPAVRWTARTSLTFFVLAFALGSRRGTVLPAARGFVLALAASHLLHFVTIGLLALQTDAQNLVDRGPAVIAAGAVGYLVIGMAVLRPDGLWAGDALWVVWGIFAVAYLPRTLAAPVPFGLAHLMLATAAAVRLSRGSLTPQTDVEGA